MKISTKRQLLRAATATAVVCAAAVVFLPATASAAPAEATASVNVRGGPSTSYPVVDTLRAGEDVDVLGCRSGWCYIEHSGPDGYVSSSYLRRTSGGSSSSMEPNFNLSFNFPNGSFSIGNGGVSIGVGPGRPDPAPGPGGPRPGRDEVCFYENVNYGGSRFCLEDGESIRAIGGRWNDRISSIRNPDGLRVTVCDDYGYRDCRTYTTSARSLGGLNDRISSIRVR